MAKIFVTGASGFIGKQLVATLLEEGHEIWALVRMQGLPLFPQANRNLHLIAGDLLRQECFPELPSDLDAAYYLVHSMSAIMGDLEEQESRVANNFIHALRATSVQQIIYLGGIIGDETQLSPHLKSRLRVEEVLKNSRIPTTVLRASIIIGSGSASFEIIRDLVEKLPLMVAPRWIESRCQPIAVRDVLYYLEHVLLNRACYDQIFDIGGPEVLTFKEAMLFFAKLRGLKRSIITVPVLTPRLSSYWLVFITSVNFNLASYLVESMKHDTICRDQLIHQVLPHHCLTYSEAINLAFQKIAQNEVIASWIDPWDVPGSLQNFIEVPKEGVLIDEQKVPLQQSEEKALDAIWSIGGKKGWYAFNRLWGLRGTLDKWVGGVGLRRGRRHPTELLPGDSVDFWRVLKADHTAKELILYAEMKLPGEAWLTFNIKEGQLVQIATFRPRGLLGRAHWYALLPFHYLIFKRMAKQIACGD